MGIGVVKTGVEFRDREMICNTLSTAVECVTTPTPSRK